MHALTPPCPTHPHPLARLVKPLLAQTLACSLTRSLQGKGSLYIRPLLLGTGGILGLGPAPTYTFAVYCAAVGSYFKVCCRPTLQHAAAALGTGHLTILP